MGSPHRKVCDPVTTCSKEQSSLPRVLARVFDRANTPSPVTKTLAMTEVDSYSILLRSTANGQEQDIVCTMSNHGEVYDVGSSHPGAGEGPKGLAVRQLKRYASWVQNVVRQ